MRAAVQAAYEESRDRSSTPTQAPPPPSVAPQSIPLELSLTSFVSTSEEPSLVVDIAFGEHHDEKIARERRRTRELAEGLEASPKPPEAT
jgi:hypothetical protein